MRHCAQLSLWLNCTVHSTEPQGRDPQPQRGNRHRNTDGEPWLQTDPRDLGASEASCLFFPLHRSGLGCPHLQTCGVDLGSKCTDFRESKQSCDKAIILWQTLPLLTCIWVPSSPGPRRGLHASTHTPLKGWVMQFVLANWA